jgi:hypothetical protein
MTLTATLLLTVVVLWALIVLASRPTASPSRQHHRHGVVEGCRARRDGKRQLSRGDRTRPDGRAAHLANAASLIAIRR